jgi:hypothetical protein
MNTRFKILAMASVALLLNLAWTGHAMGQQSEMPQPEMDRASCEEVQWNRDLLRHYPWVVEACHEAIIVDGEKWARFEAEFDRLNRDGSITSTFRNDRGRSLGRVRLMPGRDQRVLLDGRPYRFSQLQRGQVLNFYAPEDIYAFTTQPGAPASELVQVVEPTDAEIATPQLAQAQPVADQPPATLPATAGPLPVVALAALLSLLGGFSLTMRRRSQRLSA